MRGYKTAYDHVLTGRIPVLAHVDGIGFSQYTRKCAKPFDKALGDLMIDTAIDILGRVQGAVLAYTQSDEITVLLHGYKTHKTSPYRGNRVQKLVSDMSGPTSAFFTQHSHRIWDEGRLEGVRAAAFATAIFLVPENDVNNFFLWRQKDAIRNSVQMLTRFLYSHKQVDRKNVTDMKAMCNDKGHAWEDLDPRWQRGACVFKSETGALCVDKNVPFFNKDVGYVERHLRTED
jgi:tRNA(His) 5'-end guanylyltransferase